MRKGKLNYYLCARFKKHVIDTLFPFHQETLWIMNSNAIKSYKRGREINGTVERQLFEALEAKVIRKSELFG